MSLTCLSSEEKHTSDGYCIATTHPTSDNKRKRYLNPRMEQELANFKLKIKDRYEKAEIDKEYKFPRNDATQEVFNGSSMQQTEP